MTGSKKKTKKTDRRDTVYHWLCYSFKFWDHPTLLRPDNKIENDVFLLCSNNELGSINAGKV